MSEGDWLARSAGIALAGAAAVCLMASATALPPAAVRHAPIQVRRNPDGSVKRGLRGEMQSSNWSGYAIASYMSASPFATKGGKPGGSGSGGGGSGGSYTSAQLTWVVPSVTYGSSTDTTNSSEYSANWVGIGGFCENALCTKLDHTLIQLGTEQDVSPSGKIDYYAWYEMLPQSETPLSTTTDPVSPGDTMTASLSCGTTCSQKKQTWLLTMTDTRSGAPIWTWSQSFPYGSSEASAEWIEEAPYSGGVLPLADFGTASFSATGGADGASPSLTTSANGIQMKDPWGQTSNPSDPDSSDDFNACWGFQSFPPCATP